MIDIDILIFISIFWYWLSK